MELSYSLFKIAFYILWFIQFWLTFFSAFVH